MNTTSLTNVAFLKLPTISSTTTSSVWVASMPEVSQPKPRVLVIDGQGSLCELLSLYLPEKGLEVATVRTVQEARIFVERGQFDLLLLNWRLDEAKGLDLLDLSKTRHPNVPVILLNGTDLDEGFIKDNFAPAADAVIRRTGPLDALCAVIRRHLSPRRAETPDEDPAPMLSAIA